MLKLLLRLSFFLLWKIAPYLRLLLLQLLAHAIDKQPTLNFTFNRCPGNQWLQNKEPCACTPSPSTHKLAPFRQSSRLSLETSREMSHKRFYVKLDLQLHAVGGGTGGFPLISTIYTSSLPVQAFGSARTVFWRPPSRPWATTFELERWSRGFLCCATTNSPWRGISRVLDAWRTCTSY